MTINTYNLVPTIMTIEAKWKHIHCHCQAFCFHFILFLSGFIFYHPALKPLHHYFIEVQCHNSIGKWCVIEIDQNSQL